MERFARERLDNIVSGHSAQLASLTAAFNLAVERLDARIAKLSGEVDETHKHSIAVQRRLTAMIAELNLEINNIKLDQEKDNFIHIQDEYEP